MSYFILTSKKFIKEWVPYQHFFIVNDTAINTCSELSGFLVSIVKCYFQFLLLKLRVAFNLTQKTTLLERNVFVINKIYKHILVIEWGLYGRDVHRSNFDLLLSSDLDVNARPETVIEYTISHVDISKPIHKLSPRRCIYSNLYEIETPVVKRTFFLIFIYLYL